jgi:hypothetical protein
LKSENFIIELFDVGLLRWKENHAVSVSPDGIVVMNVEESDKSGGCHYRTGRECKNKAWACFSLHIRSSCG